MSVSSPSLTVNPGGAAAAKDRQRASRSHPCPVCGGTSSNCSVGADGLILCRKRSGEQSGFVYLQQARGDPQWALYRREGDPRLAEVRPPRVKFTIGPRTPDGLAAKAAELARGFGPAQRRALAEELGLPEAALEGHGIGWAEEGPHADPGGPCWTFPELDGGGRIVGISCRYAGGVKKAWPGGSRGLTVPAGWQDRDGPILLPEGPSDTFTLTALGLAAVGRPSNRGGITHLAMLLRGVPQQRRIVVLGEYDPKPNGLWPGKEGAVETAAQLMARLNRPVCWALPPPGHKDCRAWTAAQNLATDCRDAWEDAGQTLLVGLQDAVNELGGAAAPAASGLDEVDAVELLAESPDLDLHYLPLLGREGYFVKGWSHLLSAYPRTGKTELLLRCIRQWLQEGETVLYFTEEPRPIWVHRLRRNAGPWDGLRLVFGLAVDPAQLLARASAADQSVIIVDSIRNLGLMGEDETDNSELARHIAPWVAIVRIKNQTIILVHHNRKSGGQHGEGIAGGHALLGAVDIGLELLRGDPANRRLIRVYPRLIQPPELLYEMRADGEMQVLGSPAEVSLEEVRHRILEVVEEEWLTTSEVRARLDDPQPSVRQVQKALAAEAEAGTLERDPPMAEGACQRKTHRWRRKAG